MRQGFLISVFAIALVALGAAPQVRADGIDTFTYTESAGGVDASLVWQLPDSPILDPSSFTETGFTIGADSVSLSLGDFLLVFPETFTFSNSDAGGGIDGGVDGGFGRILLSAAGVDQFYTGSENNPTFVLGTYQLYNAAEQITGTLVISTPEPSALALLCVGLCAVLFVSFRKKAFVQVP